MARQEETLGEQDQRSTQIEGTHGYLEFLLRLNSNYMSIEICDLCDFPYILIQISYFHNFNVNLHHAKRDFIRRYIYANVLQRFFKTTALTLCGY